MSAAHPTRCVPNLAAKPKGEKRLLLADEVAGLRDVTQLALRRPVDRGFVVNTHLQRDIWERVFRHLLKVRATPRERLPSAKTSRCSPPLLCAPYKPGQPGGVLPGGHRAAVQSAGADGVHSPARDTLLKAAAT